MGVYLKLTIQCSCCCIVGRAREILGANLPVCMRPYSGSGAKKQEGRYGNGRGVKITINWQLQLILVNRACVCSVYLLM